MGVSRMLLLHVVDKKNGIILVVGTPLAIELSALHDPPSPFLKENSTVPTVVERILPYAQPAPNVGMLVVPVVDPA